MLLDNSEKILHLHPAACSWLGTDSTCVGQDFLTAERSREVNEAIRQAMAQGHSEIRSHREGKT